MERVRVRAVGELLGLWEGGTGGTSGAKGTGRVGRYYGRRRGMESGRMELEEAGRELEDEVRWGDAL